MFRLRPVSKDWGGSEFLKSEAGKMLEQQHWLEVNKLLAKTKPKIKEEIMEVYKKSLELPQQKFIVLYEASARGPLNPKAFQEYFSLFKQLFPKHYKSIYGKTTPAQITARCQRQMKGAR